MSSSLRTQGASGWVKGCSRKVDRLLRAVGSVPGLQTRLSVSPARGGEMETGSHHRELPEERWQTEPLAPQGDPQDHLDSATESLKLRSPPSLSWVEIHRELTQASRSSKPAALERYRRARKTGTRDRVFKKGSVVDEAS